MQCVCIVQTQYGALMYRNVAFGKLVIILLVSSCYCFRARRIISFCSFCCPLERYQAIHVRPYECCYRTRQVKPFTVMKLS